MKPKNMALMGVAVGCGLVAAIMTARLSGGSAPDTVDVLVAKKDLAVGTVLEEKDIESLVGFTKMPKSSVPPDIINEVENLKGKRLNRTLKVNNFIAITDVANDSGVKLPEGTSKYSIRMDSVRAVTGFVQAGDHVDLILTAGENGVTKSGIILRKMLVLAVDTSINRREGGQAVPTVNSVSLAVTPKQAQDLASAEQKGTLRLILRDPSNTDVSVMQPSTKIAGFDNEEKTTGPTTNTPTIPLVSLAVPLTDVPVNEKLTTENLNKYFEMREFAAASAPPTGIRDVQALRGRFVAKQLHKDVPVVDANFADEKTEAPVVAEVAQPQAKETYEQIINNQRILFAKDAKGDWRRVETAADLTPIEAPKVESKPTPKPTQTAPAGPSLPEVPATSRSREA